MANSYCETQLKRLCERIIKQGITIDNAAMLLAAALKYEATVRNEHIAFEIASSPGLNELSSD